MKKRVTELRLSREASKTVWMHPSGGRIEITKPKLKAPVKYDQGKLPHHLLPWEAIDEVVKVLKFGAAKYSPRNWEGGFEWHRMFRAIIGHTKDWWLGADKDPESGLHPLAHAACDCLFALSFVLWKRGMDDRPIKEKRK